LDNLRLSGSPWGEPLNAPLYQCPVVHAGNNVESGAGNTPREHTTSNMDTRVLALMFIVSLLTVSCGQKSSPDRDKPAPEEKRAKESDAARSSPSGLQPPEQEGEDERQPAEEEIAEDCVAFLRATKVVPAKDPNGDCPDCATSAEATEVLTFHQAQIDRISCSATTCEVSVTIRTTFNPGTGEAITGGLTGWLSPEQRTAYLHGHVPPGQQVFRVKVIYKPTGKGWRAVEFDKADPQ
jgi:hypothetical protein